MIPASNGRGTRLCSLMCGNILEIPKGCELTLSRKNITFLFGWVSFQLVSVRTSNMHIRVLPSFGIQIVWEDFLSLRLLKHLGEVAFPITVGTSFPPAALTINAKVIHCFAFSPPPPLALLFSSSSVLSGRTRKKQAVSSSFHIFSRAYRCTRVGSRSIQASTISSWTSRASPSTTRCTMLCLCLKLCNQPVGRLEAFVS